MHPEAIIPLTWKLIKLYIVSALTAYPGEKRLSGVAASFHGDGV